MMVAHGWWLVVEVTDAGPVAGLEWTVVRGARDEVFRALGEAHADDIRRCRDRAGGAWSRVARSARRRADRLERVVASSRRLLPVEAQEIGWLAEGAGLPEEDLWVYNLRGDLGHDGTGCSDVSTIGGGHVLLGHNEDGDRELVGLVRLVTLAIDGDPALTAVWYPGMLPANTFVASSAGLVVGVDHVPVPSPCLDGAGRHLVARHAQRQAGGAAAREALCRVPCAGGFAFDVADGPAHRVDLVEIAAGRSATWAVTAGDPGGEDGPAYPILRHTNHLRHLDATADGLRLPPGDRSLAESTARAAALDRVTRRVDTLADVEAALLADGVHNRTEVLWTFVTIAVDLTADVVVLHGPGGRWSGRLSAFTRGEAVTLPTGDAARP